MLFLLALLIVIALFVYDSTQPKLRTNTKYQDQVASSHESHGIGKYDITHYIDGQAYNMDDALLVFISASGTKYHYFSACRHLQNTESKTIIEIEATKIGRTLCAECADNAA